MTEVDDMVNFMTGYLLDGAWPAAFALHQADPGLTVLALARLTPHERALVLATMEA